MMTFKGDGQELVYLVRHDSPLGAFYLHHFRSVDDLDGGGPWGPEMSFTGLKSQALAFATEARAMGAMLQICEQGNALGLQGVALTVERQAVKREAISLTELGQDLTELSSGSPAPIWDDITSPESRLVTVEWTAVPSL